VYKEVPLFSVKNQKFNVIILAAGLGTRLKPATDYIPKALVIIGKDRAIDYIIRKYQHIADRFIIAIGYSADLLENYVRGKYSSLNLLFSQEDVSELSGPGKSLLYALDYASSKLPTIITFCDYVVGDYFSVDSDVLGVCKPNRESILGTYKTLVVSKDGIVTDIIKNVDMKQKEGGFTGIAMCHNTILLKSIAYNAAIKSENIDYTFDIIKKYIQKIRTTACPLSKIIEFGESDTLEKARGYVNGSN